MTFENGRLARSFESAPASLLSFQHDFWLLNRFRHYYLIRAATRTMTGPCFPPFSLVPKDAPPKICTDDFSDEEEGHIQGESDWWTDPIQ
jgi:hypothetical protein